LKALYINVYMLARFLIWVMFPKMRMFRRIRIRVAAHDGVPIGQSNIQPAQKSRVAPAFWSAFRLLADSTPHCRGDE
jgi:hypothetical protein